MRIHWQKIKESTVLFSEGDSTVYFVPGVGRVFVQAKDEKQATVLGDNPVCHLETDSTPTSDPLFMIVHLENGPLELPES